MRPYRWRIPSNTVLPAAARFSDQRKPLTLELTPGFILELGMTSTIHIGEAAKLAGVSVDTVRFYQKLGLVHVPARSTSGYRLFNQDQIHNLRFVRHAQDLGFSLSEIRDLLALRQKPHACAEVQSMLKRKVADVREKIKSLALLEAELAKALRNCDRELYSKRAIKHKDCCPLLSRLDEVEGRNGNRRVSHGRPSGRN